MDAEQIVADVIADHHMWIGDDGQPLDYLPEREARIAEFCREVAERLGERNRPDTGPLMTKLTEAELKALFGAVPIRQGVGAASDDVGLIHTVEAIIDARSSYEPVDHPLRRVGIPLNNVGRVNNVLNRHQTRAYGPEEAKCSCDHRWRTHHAHQSHLAEALAEILPREPDSHYEGVSR